MTGKAATMSEIFLKNLNQEDRKLFDESVAKEWLSWQKFGAMEELDEKTISNLPKDTKIIGTRWVHTDKNSKDRLVGYHMMKGTGKTKAQVDKEFPFQPMGWVTRQSRPDVMVTASLASQAMGSPKIKDVIELNKAGKMLKESADFKWRLKPSEITFDNCAVFVCAGSSFANVEGHKSQCGEGCRATFGQKGEDPGGSDQRDGEPHQWTLG